MGHLQPNHPQVATNAAVALIESLADFLKASGLYPAINDRVQRTAQAVLDHAATLRSGRATLEVRLDGTDFVVDDERTDSNKATVGWLRDSLTRTAVSGMRIGVDASIDSLIVFAGKLRDNLARTQRATTFEAMWEGAIVGIELFERLYVVNAEEWDHLPTELQTILSEDSSRGARMREMLDASGPIVDRLGTLLGDGQEPTDRVVGGAVDILRRILDVLPPEVLDDPVGCLNLVQTVLQSNGEAMTSLVSLSEEDANAEYRRLVLDVSSRFFARPDGKSEATESVEAEPAGPRGHAGDDAVQEDIDEFRAEFDALPESDDLALDVASVEAPIEKLGVCLDQLAAADSESQARAIETPLRVVLNTVGSECDQLLRVYLDALAAPRDTWDPWAHFTWLGGVLERAGLLQHMMERGLVQLGMIVSAFPATFGSYVDLIEDDRLHELADACEEIGVERILAVGERLFGPRGMVTERRLQRLFATGSRAVLPFAYLYLELDEVDSAPVIDLLLRLKLEGGESAALRVVDRRRLPKRYLSALCEFELRTDARSVALEKVSEALIRAFIEQSGDTCDEQRVVRAIGALKAFWSPRTEEYLRSLIKGVGFLGLRKRSKIVRNAAKVLLRTQRERTT